MFFFFAIFAATGLISCTPHEETRFTLLSPSRTGIDFENRLTETPEFNILNYLYYYDGGGVAAGDINNDGLPDLFFVGNETGNRLYLNKGDYRFEDITGQAGITDDPGAWSTGVTMADVNGSGLLDIYVSRVTYLGKSGANQLFINNGDGTFTEKAAEYGLDFESYSTQAAFFDYDNNGSLDLFLLNHSFHSEQTYGPAVTLREIHDPKAGDRLLRNDGGRFTDVTQEAGIHSSALGYGLGLAVSDINMDGWPDIYVGNDFHEDDYLYINNGDGTFTEALYSSIGHTSGSSMGNDIADITNDGYVDIISLDMMPEDREIFMRSGGPDLVTISDTKLDFGFGQKNARNTLQLHRGLDPEGTPVFSEIAFASGVARTDWSWASLLLDMDNSGFKDLLVTNGMVRRPNDLDFVRARNYSREQGRRQAGEMQGEVVEPEEMNLLRYLPELKIPNYAFRNNGDLTFSDVTAQWGLDQPGFSSGAAWADLTGNGRLDLVVSNLNMPAFIYRNNTPDDGSSNFLRVKLNGGGMNTSGIGSKVILYEEDRIFYQEHMPTRGFQSSVDHVLHFGLGEITELDSLRVIWPDRSYQTFYGIGVNRLLEVGRSDAGGSFDYGRLHRTWDRARFRDVTQETGFSRVHRENGFDDFSREPLMPYKLSTAGPALEVGDVNGDGLDDIYFGGARWQAGALYLQQPDGSFLPSNEELFERDRACEDVDAIFFDATADGQPDLYVVSGGGELTGTDPAVQDRLYINEGNGRFTKSTGRLPRLFANGSVVRPADFNGDGHTDLFVGSRAVPYQYGILPRNFLLENDGSGHFREVTETYAPELANIGMVTDAQWAHISGGTHPDLVVAGEWMPVQLFRNDGRSLSPVSEAAGLSAGSGLWQSIRVEDLTGDDFPDIIAGNFGKNSRLEASDASPLRLYVNDFEGNGLTSPVLATRHNGRFYPFEQLDELLTEFPFLTREIRSYRDFASRSMEELFGKELVNAAMIREVTELASVIWFNNGDGTFRKEELPAEAQLAPVLAIHILDPDERGMKDILLGGNLHGVKPSAGGRQDAFYGVHLKMNDEGFYRAMTLQASGFYTPGAVRSIREVRRKDDRLILVARNNDGALFFADGQSRPLP